MKNTKLFANSILFFSLFVGGCSLEIGNPKKPRPSGTEELSQAAIDSELIGEQADTGLTVVSESAESAAASFLGLANENALELTDSTTCDDSLGNVVFSVVRERTWTTSELRKLVSIDVSHTRSLSRTRTITATGASCQNNKPNIDWSATSSATINTQLTRSHNWTATVPDALSARMPAERTATTTLEQTTTISRSTHIGGVSTLQKSSTYTGSHTMSLAHRNGSARSVTASAKTLEPIVVTFTMSGGIVQSKVVVSGKTESTDTSGGIVQQTFNNLTYSDALSCTPGSGTITGSLLNADASTRDTFTITFESGKGVIAFGSGESQTYQPDCQ